MIPFILKKNENLEIFAGVFLVILMIPFIYEKNENLEIFGCV